MTGKLLFLASACYCGMIAAAEDFPKPYSPPCTERENVFEFTEKPVCKYLGDDRFEITFAVKGFCDVTAAIMDPNPDKELVKGRGVVVRHLASGVLGPNAPAPLQKKSLKQTIYWDGKCDLGDYPREPHKLQLRVMLGLKPEFEKRLGPSSPHAMPGFPWGLAPVDDGVLAMSIGTRGRLFVRKFDFNGKYLQTVLPPPPNIPEEKLSGYTFVEYEAGKRSILGPCLNESLTSDGYFQAVRGGMPSACRPAVLNGRLYYTNHGYRGELVLHWTNADGSGGDDEGIAGVNTSIRESSMDTHVAGSADGRWVYLAPTKGEHPCIYRWPTDRSGGVAPFLGKPRAPGSGPSDLGSVEGIDVDAKGRIYVADKVNNAVKVFGPSGEFLKLIALDRPKRVAVCRKTDAIYVSHQHRVHGRSMGRITQFESLNDPRPIRHLENVDPLVMIAVAEGDSPRLWLAVPEGRFVGGLSTLLHQRGRIGVDFCIWEGREKEFKKVLDFFEEATRNDPTYPLCTDIWSGSAGHENKTVCDPVREEVYYSHLHGTGGKFRFDLSTGRFLDVTALTGFDQGFDKRGYVHCHLGGVGQAVVRLDPSQGRMAEVKGQRTMRKLTEVPYDYGEESKGWIGPIRTKCQSGAQAFLDGMGVNMRGDVAINSNIFYVPKMDDATQAAVMGSRDTSSGKVTRDGTAYSKVYPEFIRSVMDKEKKGESVYFIKRRPGLPLSGATIWTYDANGELRAECAAVVGDRQNDHRAETGLDRVVPQRLGGGAHVGSTVGYGR